MIDKTEVMKLLLSACPSYKDRWIDHLKYFYGDGSEQLLYVDLGDFADHLVELYKSDKIEEFHKVFDVIELLHIEGDDYVKEAATIGLLEGIQNISSNSNVKQEEFLVFLKPVSEKWWRSLNNFWSGKTKYVGG